jgi:hypothetical protein
MTREEAEQIRERLAASNAELLRDLAARHRRMENAAGRSAF